ncbi:MAG: hypothetical protein ABI543_01745 [Ignavibacteria bacterium]
MRKTLTYFLSSFILMVFTVLLISSCGKDNVVNNNSNPPEPVDTSDFMYPFTTGSYWNYSITRSVENVRPDSIAHYFSNYPVTGYGYNEIMYDTNIPIGGTVRVIFDRTVTGTDTLASRYYYTNSINSMVCYGYRGSATPSFPFRIGQQYKISAEGRYFDSFAGLSSFLTNGFDVSSAQDTFIVLSPVVVTLKYPMLRNTEWTIFNFGSNIISKKYIGFENYHLDTAVISCMKTQRIWSNNSDYIFYDYYSKYGQMKKFYTFKNQPVTNMLGQTIGYADYKELYNVTSFNIIE